MANLRNYTGIIILLVSLALPAVAAIENNTIVMASASKTLLFTILGFDVDILHIILIVVVLMIILFTQRDKIRKWWEKIREIRSKRGKIEEENKALKKMVADIARELDVGTDGLGIESFKPIKEDIIGKIGDVKTESKKAKEQLKSTAELKYLKEIASSIGLRLRRDETPEDISEKIKSQISSYSTIKYILNSIYKVIPTSDWDVEDIIKQAEKIEIYVKEHNKLRNSVERLIRVEGAELLPKKDIESLLSAINSLIPSFKEYKDTRSEQEELSKAYEAILSDLKEEVNKTEFDEQNYKSVLNNLIYFIQNRNDCYRMGNNVKNLTNAIESLHDENKKLSAKSKEIESITKEFEKTNSVKLGNSISQTQGILNDIKFAAEENIVKILDAIGNHLDELSYKVNIKEVGNRNISIGLREYVIKEQVRSIENLLLTIKSGIDTGMKPSVTIGDVETAIKSAKEELGVLKGHITDDRYSSTCNHEIPIHYEALIFDLIKRSEEKCRKGKLREAHIIISDAMNVIEYTKGLYEKVNLSVLLEMIRKK